MGTYDRQIATALRLIAKYGQLVDWKQDTEVTDPDQPWLGTVSGQFIYKPRIAFVGINRDDYATFGYRNDGDVPKGAVKGLMAAVEFEPSVKDTIVRNGRVMNIDRMDVVNINGEIILHKIIFKY